MSDHPEDRLMMAYEMGKTSEKMNRIWKCLSDNEVERLAEIYSPDLISFARAIEFELKKKNHIV